MAPAGHHSCLPAALLLLAACLAAGAAAQAAAPTAAGPAVAAAAAAAAQASGGRPVDSGTASPALSGDRLRVRLLVPPPTSANYSAASLAYSKQAHNYTDTWPGCNCSAIPAVYQPVCGNDITTYGNPCVAYCGNVPILYAGECERCVIGSTAECSTCAPETYAPVCVQNALTWESACSAKCGGRNCYTDGVCQYNPVNTFLPTTGGTSTRAGARAAAANTALPARGAARYNYAEPLHLHWLFFHSQRSGKLDKQPLAWRGDSMVGFTGAYGEDLSGGYLEAGGSYLKAAMVHSFFTASLSWAVLAGGAGFAKLPADRAAALEAIKWGADYIVASHPQPDVYVALVGNYTLDFQYFGPVEEYEQYVPPRPVCYINSTFPGSELAADAAAGLAAAYLVFNKSAEAAPYLAHARQLYDFAVATNKSFMDIPYNGDTNRTCIGLMRFFASPNNGQFLDELAWAATWLYKATGEPAYLADARRYHTLLRNGPDGGFAIQLDNQNKHVALPVLLAEADPDNFGTYDNMARNYFNVYFTSVPTTAGGLAYPYHWGALRPATYAAFLALSYSNVIAARDAPYAARLFNWAAYQVNYVLGDSGRSWISGYGKGYPTYVWHKESYFPSIAWDLRGVFVWANTTYYNGDGSTSTQLYLMASSLESLGSYRQQTFTPYGALYAAPLLDDGLVQSRRDYTYAEPTTDGQNGLVGALAILAGYFDGQTATTDCGLDLGWTHPNATLTPASVNNTALCSGGGGGPAPALRPAAGPSAAGGVATASVGRRMI